MHLTLSPDEATELRELLDAALADLRSEIHHTDTPDFRERLHQRERHLQRLRARLDADDAPA
jgi:hypothetical protein